jgi:hypothetical protein
MNFNYTLEEEEIYTNSFFIVTQDHLADVGRLDAVQG